MRLFDLHCDTITVLEERGGALRRNDLHISLERVMGYERFVQVFAVFIPDELRGEEAVAYFDRVHGFYLRQTEENRDLISPYLSPEATPCKAILAVEGGAAAAGSIEGLRHLFDCGVRLMTLTWNGQNEIASGCWAEPEGGLTDFGRLALSEMERLGMVADVSHLSKRGFWEVAEQATRPFIASHSNCDIADNMYGHKRNLDDAQVRCLIAQKGLMGLNLCDVFLADEAEAVQEQGAALDWAWRHISHALDLGAEQILALGCDFDGCTPPPALAGVERMGLLYDFLLSKNMSETFCERLFYGNADEFFSGLYT